MKYSTDPVINKRCQQYLANRRRIGKARSPVGRYLAHGGPFNGQQLLLTRQLWGNSATATIRMGNHVGRYVECPREGWTQAMIDTRLPRGVAGHVLWENISQ